MNPTHTFVEAVQRGVRSHWYRSGRYSPTRERGVHHFHRLLCEFMNDKRPNLVGRASARRDIAQG